VIAVARDLRRARWPRPGDGAAMAAADGSRRLAQGATPLRRAWNSSLSLLETGANRALGRAAAPDLEPLLARRLRALEGTEQATR
jgi:thymidine phosphorylase